MSFIWLLPFGLQGVVIAIDEFYFHRGRGLPPWERISHPIDTLTLLACVIFTILAPYSPQSLKIYIVLAVLSCISITKDEFVHTQNCEGAEHWLHSVLFVLHPIVLCEIGWLWQSRYYEFVKPFFIGEAFAASGFLFYQTIYWNWIKNGTSLEVLR